MATLLKCGALFLHIPKTGGSWISAVLEDNNLVFAHIGGKHSTLERLGNFEKLFRMTHRYGKPNKPFFRFCFVRHPLRWYESWFTMMSSREWPIWGTDPDYWNPSAILDGLGDTSFNGFISNVLSKRPGFVTEMYGAYTSHGIDYIGRQENIADDLIKLLEFLGLKFNADRVRDFKPVNASGKTRIEWRPDLQEATERAEYASFQRFGYKTELYIPSPVPPASSAVGFAAYITDKIPLTGAFVRESGYAWQIGLPQWGQLADHLIDPYRSPLVLLEDLRALPYGHALHADIRQKGGGRYSHWQNSLLFSSSDNSDPNKNGRGYTIRFQFGDGNRDDSMLISPYLPAE